MFSILKNHPVPTGLPDTAFTNGTGTIGKGQYIGQKYTTSAAGQPIHGLNINNVVLNTIDFGAPVEYVVSFRVPTAGTEKAWDGVEWRAIGKYTPSPQITGFRSGDVNLFCVPGFNAVRTASTIDTTNKLAWKSYALISGRDRYTFGKPLKRDSWLCSFGVGRTYKITFLGSTGSTAANRTFSFIAKLYGQFGAASKPVQVFGVEGPRDYQGNTDADILPTGMLPNLRTCEKWRVEDFTTNGQRAIVSAYIPPNIAGVEFEDDGVSDVCSAPVAWLQFTFTEDGDDLKVAYEVLANYQENTSAKSIGYTTLLPVLPDMSAPSKYTRVGIIAAPIPANATPDYIEVYTPYKLTYFDYGSGFPQNIEYIEGNIDGGTRRGTPASLIGEIGKYYGGSPGNRIKRTRLVHVCYDATDTICIASVSYMRYRHNDLKKLISLTGHSDYYRMPRANPLVVGGAAYADYEIETTPEYDLFDFTLLVNGASVGSFKVESKKDSYIDKGRTYMASAGELPPPSRESLPPETKQTVSPVTSHGALSIGGAPDPVCGWQIDNPFRDTGVGDDHPDAWIRPFVRVDANKVVSFVIAREGFSAAFEKKPAGNNALYPLVTPSLLSGNHFYKATYDMYNKRMLVNTSAHGNAANPAMDIAGSKYVCTLNPATGEAVLNGESVCTWV